MSVGCNCCYKEWSRHHEDIINHSRQPFKISVYEGVMAISQITMKNGTRDWRG